MTQLAQSFDVQNSTERGWRTAKLLRLSSTRHMSSFDIPDSIVAVEFQGAAASQAGKSNFYIQKFSNLCRMLRTIVRQCHFCVDFAKSEYNMEITKGWVWLSSHVQCALLVKSAGQQIGRGVVGAWHRIRGNCSWLCDISRF
ncbi:hypothetical protein [Sphingobium terrigena]|uniref:hypothetical protein n=1 Tax=Sphingobium terrigena TaxID=2304063 RepID=UPI0011C3B5FB|nr:hypothetical protein [Sphingobium terrigena]